MQWLFKQAQLLCPLKLCHPTLNFDCYFDFSSPSFVWCSVFLPHWGLVPSLCPCWFFSQPWSMLYFEDSMVLPFCPCFWLHPFALVESIFLPSLMPHRCFLVALVSLRPYWCSLIILAGALSSCLVEALQCSFFALAGVPSSCAVEVSPLHPLHSCRCSLTLNKRIDFLLICP